jgi:hypothetical protein
VLELVGSNPDQYLTGRDARQYPFDIENTQEKCTPYTLALLREEFEMADLLLLDGRSDKYYKNCEREDVYGIARRLNIKSVQRYLIKQQHNEQNGAGGGRAPAQVSPSKPLIVKASGAQDQDARAHGADAANGSQPPTQRTAALTQDQARADARQILDRQQDSVMKQPVGQGLRKGGHIRGPEEEDNLNEKSV